MENKTLVENAERWLTEDEMIVENYDYYYSQLEKLLPIDEYGITIKVRSTNGQTNELNLNEESLKALEVFYKENKFYRNANDKR